MLLKRTDLQTLNMGSIGASFPFRIGVDVGGTNTDAVIVDTTVRDRSKCVIAGVKTATTSPNVTDGIEAAVKQILQQSKVPTDRISSLAIGTTHFINAIVEHDQRHLSKVAVIRLSRSFTREVPPFSDFPASLKKIMYGWHTYIDGGLHIDGSQEAPIVEQQVVEASTTIKGLGLTAVVICGVFSPLDTTFLQEKRVREIVLEHLPNVSVVCSSEISNLGFLERENASILNASIHRFARRTISEFRLAMKRLELRCALYLTQNDGTLIDADSASRLPIRTFSSGPTNSMRGAAYLSGLYEDGALNETCIVCDIGGTTSDVGILLPSGYPRQSLANASVAGVKINYGMPQVESIGIGGGSIVRHMEKGATVGPDSVGYAIREKARIFGGETITATDIAAVSGAKIAGSNSKLVADIDSALVQDARRFIQAKLERLIDLVKTSPQPLDLILVGGGSVIAPESLRGVNKIIQPPYHDVANAVGAAMSRVSASVDIIQDTSTTSIKAALSYAAELAVEKAIQVGADPETITISEQEALPLQYLNNRVRTIVKAVGDYLPFQELTQDVSFEDLDIDTDVKLLSKDFHNVEEAVVFDPDSYRPRIARNPETGVPEWVISATDVQWMSDGCYLLGCAGGGTPYPEMLKLKKMLEDGHTIRIIDVEDVKPEAQVYCEFVPRLMQRLLNHL